MLGSCAYQVYVGVWCLRYWVNQACVRLQVSTLFSHQRSVGGLHHAGRGAVSLWSKKRLKGKRVQVCAMCSAYCICVPETGDPRKWSPLRNRPITCAAMNDASYWPPWPERRPNIEDLGQTVTLLSAKGSWVA